MYYVYMLKNFSGKLYIGVTKDVSKRLKVHNTKRGARYTKSGNFEIVFYEPHKTLTEARTREVQIKKWRRDKKEFLIALFKKHFETSP